MGKSDVSFRVKKYFRPAIMKKTTGLPYWSDNDFAERISSCVGGMLIPCM